MSAPDELVAYGYTEEDGGFVRYKGGRPRDKWAPTVGGFYRFTRDDGAWLPIPYKIAPAFEGVSGLTYAKQPQCFDMVYPEAEIERIYAGGRQAREEQDAESAARKAGG